MNGRHLGVAAALVGSLVLPAGCGDPDPARGILLVTIDTCRADRIGCYGAGPQVTPVLDAIAARGARFASATAVAPLTLPSHSSILTGLYPDRHTLRDNGTGRLPEEAVSIAEVLAARGWRTAAFVSAVPLGSEFGTEQGFSVYDEDFSSSAAGGIAGTDAGREVVDRLFYEERIASETVGAAGPWMREARASGDPYLAWVHFFDPHAVYAPPPTQAARFGPGSYQGEIAFVDEQIGRLLEEVGGGEDLIVLVTADHGESLGDHGEQSHGLFVYESTLHVPWILAGPGIPAGTVVEGAVSIVDVAPTLLEAAGAPVPEGLDGRSRLGAAVRGEVPDSDVFGECLLPRLNYNWAGLRSVRRGSWKFIEAPEPELYDLAADPTELRNVAAEHPETVAQLRQALEVHGARGGELSGEAVDVDPLVREQLERLGYVGVGGSGGTDLSSDDVWNPGGRDPKDMVDFFNRFQEIPTLMMDGRNDEAARTLAQLREEDPGNFKVLERFAMLRRTQEQWDEVIPLCEEMLSLAPDDARVRRNLAFARLQSGDAAGAVDDYGQLLVATPEDPEAWALLGSALSDAGRHAEAIETLRRAVALAPQDAGFGVALAQGFEESGDTEGALAEYDRALETDPRSAEALNGKALLLSHGGRAREAADVLRAGLASAGENLDTLNNLAWILVNEELDPEEGYRHARRARELAPDDPAVLDTFGWSAIRSGRPGEAIAPLTRALEMTGDAEVRAHLGIALAETGRTGDGRTQVRAAVEERASLAEIPEVARWR